MKLKRRRQRRNKPLEKRSFTLEETAILTTLLYADIFHFPLTEEELWQYLINKNTIDKRKFTKSLFTLAPYIVEQNGYFALKNKSTAITHRQSNLAEVANKMTIAQKVAQRLVSIPSILFIGISGGLAVGNVSADDDIDLFIIVKQNTIFATRFWILILLQLMGRRRTRLQKNAANLLCINLLIDETSLVWPKAKQDIYTAHEIAQIKPLFERNNTFKRFLANNTWVHSFLPNTDLENSAPKSIDSDGRFMQLFEKIVYLLPVESILRKMQIVLIQRHRTTETVTKHHLAFHPKDYRLDVLRQLRLKTRQFGLLTKF